MKIRLERWKEVIRVEFDKDKHFKNFVTDLGSICFDNKHGNTIAEHITLYIENEDSNYIYFLNKFLDTFLQMVEEHNNSIKDDDGYKFECQECKPTRRCYCTPYKMDIPCGCLLYKNSNLYANWQKITNKEKIKIIEED